jgi:hypothetical protein
MRAGFDELECILPSRLEGWHIAGPRRAWRTRGRSRPAGDRSETGEAGRLASRVPSSSLSINGAKAVSREIAGCSSGSRSGGRGWDRLRGGS